MSSETRDTERLSGPRFLEELRHVVRFRVHPSVGDPLQAVVKRIELNPAYSQARLLTRILIALTHQQGDFRRAEISALDSETLAMVITLMDEYAAGTSTRDNWLCAVDAAMAAQRGTGS